MVKETYRILSFITKVTINYEKVYILLTINILGWVFGLSPMKVSNKKRHWMEGRLPTLPSFLK